MGYTMTKTKAPREFWILTPPNNKDRVIYDSNPQWIGERNLVAHVREVLPDDEFATYISDLLKTRSETFDELERTKKALAKAKQVFSENNNIHVLREIEAIEKGES